MKGLDPEYLGEPLVVEEQPVRRFLDTLLTGILGCIAGLLIAMAIHRIQLFFGGDPAKTIGATCVLFGVLVLLPSAVWIALLRGKSSLSDIGLLFVIAASRFYLTLPADFVIWSESDFVNDVLKFRVGYPIFSAQVNNDSFTYVPGTQLLTYFLAWLSGSPLSVPRYRLIQLGYTFLSTLIAFICWYRIISIAGVNVKGSTLRLWGALSFPVLLLAATNSITNPFTHLLHNDALTQLVTLLCFWLVLEYGSTQKRWLLIPMVVIPAAGFWVKQSILVWICLFGLNVLLFSRPRSLVRTVGFGFASLVAAVVSVGIGYFLWQDNFVYWTFTVLGRHEVSPLRSIRHLLTVWPYFVIGLLGGVALMRPAEGRHLLGPWLIWLSVISIETYTSGIAWMTNHIGPGSLIASVFFVAGAMHIVYRSPRPTVGTARPFDWIATGACAAVVCLVFSGLGMVRIPISPFSEEDSRRYISEIEHEFAGEPADRVLLDVGTWVYLSSGSVMKDRAPTIGERGYSQTGDFSGVLERLNNRFYTKILVRNFHSGDFWYDHALWSTSSGIRDSLRQNYREVGRIRAISGIAEADSPYGFREISILVPREN